MSDFTTNAEDNELTQSAEINPADIRLAAMNLLARREHSVVELRKKLLRRFTDEGLVSQELHRLADENLQSDVRYAEAYVSQRSARGYGPLRIQQEMRERGLSDTQITASFKTEAPDWSAIAAQAYSKKFGHCSECDLKEKSRRVRFMQYRGFSAEHYRYLLPG